MYDRQIKLLKETEKSVEYQERQDKRRFENQKKLIEKYEQRIEQFLMSMNKDPVKIRKYCDPMPHVQRPHDPSRYLGRSTLTVSSFKTEKERVQEAILNSSFNQTIPVKEPAEQSRKPSVNISRSSSVFQRSTGGQKGMENLKQRMHFKTLLQLAQLQKGPANISRIPSTQNKKRDNYRSDTANILYNQGKSLIKKHKSLPDKTEIAKSVLAKCYIVNSKKHSDFLQVGQGRLVSNPWQSNKYVFQRLNSSFQADRSQQEPTKLLQALDKIKNTTQIYIFKIIWIVIRQNFSVPEIAREHKYPMVYVKQIASSLNVFMMEPIVPQLAQQDAFLIDQEMGSVIQSVILRSVNMITGIVKKGKMNKLMKIMEIWSFMQEQAYQAYYCSLQLLVQQCFSSAKLNINMTNRLVRKK